MKGAATSGVPPQNHTPRPFSPPPTGGTPGASCGGLAHLLPPAGRPVHICIVLPYILPAYSCTFTAFIQCFMHSIPCFSIPSCITIRKTPLLRRLVAVAVRRFCGHNAQHSRTVAAVSAVLWAVAGWGCTLERDQYSLSGVYLVPICGPSGFCLESCAISSAVYVYCMQCSVCSCLCAALHDLLVIVFCLFCWFFPFFPVYSLCDRLSLFPVCCLVLSCCPSLCFSFPCFLLFCVSLQMCSYIRASMRRNKV